MRGCYLKFPGDEEESEWQVDATGHALISEGTECVGHQCRIMRTKGPKRRVRIGRHIGYVGSATNRAGAVYEAEDLGPDQAAKMKDHSGRLLF